MDFERWGLPQLMLVSQAAVELNVSMRRVRQLIEHKVLEATPVGKRLWLVTKESVDYYKTARRPRGRPRKHGRERDSVTDNEYFTTAEVAATLRVNVQTVRNWIRARELRAFPLGGRRAGYRVSDSDLRAFLERGKESYLLGPRGRPKKGADGEPGE
jgi:excisionase family DNA binding protein